MKRRWTDALFSPRGVAVVGSSSNPSKLAWGTLEAVLNNVSNRNVVAIDRHCSTPKHSGCSSDSHLHQFQHPDEVPSDLASSIEQAVLVTSCHSTLERMRECIHAFPSLSAVNVVSGGFRESLVGGGETLEQQLVQEAKRHHIRLIGPNSVGAIDTYSDFASMFLRVFPPQGGFSLLSQSGGMCGAAVELTHSHCNVGFSKVLSLGNAADVGFVDALSAVKEDPNTHVILLYLEGLGSNDVGDEFIEIARSISQQKPIVALKGGKTPAGSRAVSSHTGAMAGNERIYEAAFRAAGIVEAPSLRAMLDMAHALSCHSRVPLLESDKGGNKSSFRSERRYRTAVITNAGGPGAVTVDQIVSGGAANVTALPDNVQEMIRNAPDIHKLSATANPVDLLGGATPLSYRSALQTTLASDKVDAAVCLHVPTALSNPANLATELISISKQSSKPLVAMMVSSDHDFVDSAVSMLHGASIPTFCHSEAVRDAFRAWKQREDRYPTTALKDGENCVNKLLSESQTARGRRYLTKLGGPRWVLEHEARELLDIVGIDQPRAILLHSGQEADVVSGADEIGYPVVLKRVDSVHKSDKKGGVALNLRDSTDVQNALRVMLAEKDASPPILVCKQVSLHAMREFFVGFTRDEVFGPVVCFGSGGTMVEALGDVAFALPPRSRRDTVDLMSRAKLAARRITAGGIRYEAPVDPSAIARVVEQCAALAIAFPDIAELDVNPLLVGLSQGGKTTVLAADVKFRLGAK